MWLYVSTSRGRVGWRHSRKRVYRSAGPGPLALARHHEIVLHPTLLPFLHPFFAVFLCSFHSFYTTVRYLYYLLFLFILYTLLLYLFLLVQYIFCVLSLFEVSEYMFYYFASSFMTLDEGYVVGCCHYSKDSRRCYLIDVRNTVSKILAAAMLLLLSPLNVSLIDPGPATLPYDPKLRSTSFFCVHCHLIDPTGIYFSQSESLRFAPHRTTS